MTPNEESSKEKETEEYHSTQEIVGTNGEREVWEKLPAWVQCPACKQKEHAYQVFGKRGLAYRCKKCSWDSHQLEDLDTHKQLVMVVARRMKDMFPNLLFVENVPVFNDPLTGETGDQYMRYDFSIYWFGKKMERCRVAIIRNTQVDHYLDTEEQYLVGIQKTVEYLSQKNRDGLVILYFPDEKDAKKQICVAAFRELYPHLKQVTDRFNHEQYSVPVPVRKILFKFGKDAIAGLVFRNFYKTVTQNRYVI